jgi:hypothetical protein
MPFAKTAAGKCRIKSKIPERRPLMLAEGFIVHKEIQEKVFPSFSARVR